VTAAPTRTAEDALGPVLVPADAYYGAQTQRATENFDISGVVLGDFPGYLAAIAEVKKAAALANADIGVLRPEVAAAIARAADELIAGTFDRGQFPVDALNAGGGVSPNMNVNEVLATRANEILCGRRGNELVHPNNHVNAGQSTSDVIETAVSLALHRDILRLIDSVRLLEDVLEAKIDEHRDTVKLARTCLQDAVPITFAQEFGAYLAVARRGVERLAAAADACLDIPMGGTVVGTGLGVGAGYVDRIYPRLVEVTGLAVRRHPDFFDAFTNGDVFQHLSTTFKSLATGVAKMAKDLRILASGNRSGLGEITLPAVQAGSSLMPGKINPVMPELMIQIGYQVCGNDTVVTMAVDGADVDFNVWSAVIAKNLFESCRLLTNGIPLFAERCVRGLQVRTDRCRGQAESTLGVACVVASVYGYETGAEVAHHAADHDLSIEQAAVDLGVMSPASAAALLDPLALTDMARSAEVVDAMVAAERDRIHRVVAGLAPATRRAVLDVVTAVARVDGRLHEQERLAIAVAAEALGPDLPAGPTDLECLPTADRDLVYACAAWMARADEVVADQETALLAELRVDLGLDDPTTARLDALVADERTRHRHVPRSESLPWWDNLARLLDRLHLATRTL
jgi:aspartate ammonia-lyase